MVGRPSVCVGGPDQQLRQKQASKMDDRLGQKQAVALIIVRVESSNV